jgi:hypothetical protein
MSSPRQRLYHTKLQFLATACTVAGIALLLLARWAEQLRGWEWLRVLPIIDLGSAFFTAGLIVIAFEYIDREDGEIRAIQRLRQVLGEQAPAMRDAVIDGFAFKPDDLTRVASPETLDRIARNSLAIQLGDRALAEEVYADVRQQVIGAKERWHGLDVSVSLSPWEQGPVAGSSAMFVATVRCEYQVVPGSPVMRFACVSDLAEYRELSRDPSVTAVWYFEPVRGLDGAAADAFELAQFAVDGHTRPIRRTARAGTQIYTVSLGKQAGSSSRAVKLSYIYRTLVQQNGHLLYVDITKPTKGLRVELWYGDCGIKYVNVLDMIASSTQARVARTPDTVPTPSVAVGFDGWVFPRSGVAFVWVLEDELALRHR